jgi:hypothetical protein
VPYLLFNFGLSYIQIPCKLDIQQTGGIMKLLFLTLLFLFISLWAKPSVAFEEQGNETPFSSFDETGKGGVVQIGAVPAISIADQGGGCFTRSFSVINQPFSDAGPHYKTGHIVTAFRRDADRVGLCLLGVRQRHQSC